MIYFTTFIFTLLLAHIAHAEPACGDTAPPADVYEYDRLYENEQLVFDTYKVTSSDKYSDPAGSTQNTACSYLVSKYPTFGDFPEFPNVGAAFDVPGPQDVNCLKCWNLTGQQTKKHVYFLAIDTIDTGFVLSKQTYSDLNNGPVPPVSYADALPVDHKYCGLE